MNVIEKIFTPDTISRINQFLREEVFEGTCPDFDFTETYSFSQYQQYADRYDEDTSEFWFDLNTCVYDFPEFKTIMSHFAEHYLFCEYCELYTRVDVTVDRESNTLFVKGRLDLKSTGSFDLDVEEAFVIADGSVISYEEYKREHGAKSLRDFKRPSEFNENVDTTKSVVIELN